MKFILYQERENMIANEFGCVLMLKVELVSNIYLHEIKVRTMDFFFRLFESGQLVF